MRARWEALRGNLLRSVTTLKADQQFRKAGEEDALYRFDAPDALVAYLATRGGDLDEKDRIYKALVRALQAHSDWADTAAALLWLGLWPGLDAVYRRQLRYFNKRPDDLVEEITYIFTTTIARIDLSRVNRLAATLVMNVERDVREGLKRSWRNQERTTDIAPLANDLRDQRPNPSDRRLPVDADDLAAVRAWLVVLGGDDANLVVDAILRGFDQHELADGLGISHQAARKRIQRVLKRIRHSLERERNSVPPGLPGVRLGGGRPGKEGMDVTRSKKVRDEKPARMRLVTREDQT